METGAGAGPEGSAARFTAPVPSAGLALRSAVLARLSEPTTRLGVITAPAGYGKSSHAAAWVAGEHRTVAWIDLEVIHDDARVLLTDLVEALSAITDFTADGLPLGGASRDQYTTGVSVALGRAVRACAVPFVLVVDDVQVVQDESAVDLLGSLVANVPEGSEVLLLGRSCPLEDLGRMRVASGLVEVEAGDLALDEFEVMAVLDDMGVEATAEQALDVAKSTEGWPVGVRLAGMVALDPGPEPSREPFVLSGREVSVGDYLDSQWMRDVADDDRDALTRLSALEWLSAPLANEVLGRTDMGEVLGRIFQRRHLLIPLDRRGDRYRMHALLRDALRSEFERSDPRGFRRLHQRASSWFESTGDPDAALRHAMAADDLDRSEYLVAANTASLYTNGRYRTIARWVEDLPREKVLASPRLCLSAALAALGGGRRDEVQVWIRTGEHAAAQQHADEFDRLCLSYLRSSTTIGPVRPALDAAAGAYAGLPPGIWHAATCVALGGWTWTAGEPGAADLLREGAEESLVHGAPALEAYCCATLAAIAHDAQDPVQAWTLVERARRVAADHDLSWAPGIALITGMTALEEASAGEPETSMVSWKRSRVQLSQMGPGAGWANVHTRIVLARVSLILGDGAGAELMIREAREYLARQPDASLGLRRVSELEGLVRGLRPSSGGGYQPLTTAELRVLRYLPTNLSLAQIGERLYVSRYTVKTHCGSIYRKLGVGTRSAAVDVARNRGLLDRLGWTEP